MIEIFRYSVLNENRRVPRKILKISEQHFPKIISSYDFKPKLPEF